MKYLTYFITLYIITLISNVKASILYNVYARSIQSPQAGSSPVTETGPNAPTEPSVTIFYYNQTIDHFDKNSGTFLQRYCLNSTFYKEGGPIFLHTPGEAGIDSRITTNSFVNELAASFNGLLISIEHRYYGESYPPGVTDLSTENMRFLTVDQALSDFANFIQNPPQELNITSDAKWITVGGSYGGNLAAWMRKKFPDLVFAAYASSAPVEAKLDFFEFDQRIANALPCAQNISDAFKFVFDPILTSGNSSAIFALKQQFGLEMLEDDKDFASAISHPTASIMQSYVPPQSSDQLDTILAICGPFGQVDSSPEASAFIYIEGVKAFLKIEGIITPEDKIKKFATTGISTKERNDLASYTYQYCNELGYYQTAPRSSLKTRSSIVDIAYFQGQCDFLFPGIVSSPTVEKTNKKFGGFNSKFSRTIFVSGGIDPWTALTVSSESAKPMIEGDTRFLIEGGSHVLDFRPSSQFDSDSLVKARTFVRDTLTKWL